jgi:SEP domain
MLTGGGSTYCTCFAYSTSRHAQMAVACVGQIRNAPKKKKKMMIKFYQNAIFTVDDGPPRSLEDSANQAFLQAIKERRVPDELASEFQDGLDLSIMQMSEDYDPGSAPKCDSSYAPPTLGIGLPLHTPQQTSPSQQTSSADLLSRPPQQTFSADPPQQTSPSADLPTDMHGVLKEMNGETMVA